MGTVQKPVDTSTLVVRQNNLPSEAHDVAGEQRQYGRRRLLNWIVPFAVLLLGALAGDPGVAAEVVVDAATRLRGHFLDAVFRQVGNGLRCFHRRVSLPLDQYPSGGQKQLRAG